MKLVCEETIIKSELYRTSCLCNTIPVGEKPRSTTYLRDIELAVAIAIQEVEHTLDEDLLCFT